METIKIPPGYGFLLAIDFSLYAASARVAPGKSENGMYKSPFRVEWKEEGKGGEADD